MGISFPQERTNEERLQLIIESLRLLATDADVQIICFPDFVFIPDEIVLTFGEWHDMYRDRLIAAEMLTEEQDSVLRRIRNHVGRMSRHGDLFREELWSLEAVRQDKEWQTLRELACAALMVLHQEKRPPGDLGFGYVPAKTQ